MRKLGVCLALTGATLWLTGCGMQLGGQSSSSPRSGIAVVDLSRVAQETGRGVEMQNALNAQSLGIKQQLLKFQDEANSKIQAKYEDLNLKELGDSAPENVKREYLQVRNTEVNKLTQVKNQAGAEFNQFQQNQLANFRVQLKPFLNEVAAKRGLSVVIPKNDGLLLAVDPGADITDDVIKAYLAKKPAPTPAASAAASAPAQSAPTRPARTAAKEPRDSDGDGKR